MTSFSETTLPGSDMKPLSVLEQTAYVDSGPIVVDSVKVVFTISGRARVTSPVGEVFLESGSILTIPANLECRGFPNGYARTVTLYLHPEYLVDQMRWLSAKHPLVQNLHCALEGEPQLQQLQLAAPEMYELAPTLARMARLSTSAAGGFAMLSMTTGIFDAVGRLAHVASNCIDEPSPKTAPARQEVIVAIALMRSNLRRAWRIDDLAREVALSGSQLARLFRSQMGVSPAAFLRQLRTDKMAELLSTTRLSIGEIALAVGLGDLAVASRAFKQRYGVAPRDYAGFYRGESPERDSQPDRLNEAPVGEASKFEVASR